jgi:hypothetical protein
VHKQFQVSQNESVIVIGAGKQITCAARQTALHHCCLSSKRCSPQLGDDSAASQQPESASTHLPAPSNLRHTDQLLLMRHLGILRNTGIASSWLRSASLSRTAIETGTTVLRCNRLHVQAASTPRGIDAASRRQTDVKHLARAFRPVPLAVVTVSKGNSKGPAEDLSGTDKARHRWHWLGCLFTAASM